MSVDIRIPARLASRISHACENIELADHRALCCDGPVSPTWTEMSQKEIQEVFSTLYAVGKLVRKQG